jgi:hypothetical protein
MIGNSSRLTSRTFPKKSIRPSAREYARVLIFTRIVAASVYVSARCAPCRAHFLEQVEGRIRPMQLADPEWVTELRESVTLGPLRPIPEQGPVYPWNNEKRTSKLGRVDRRATARVTLAVTRRRKAGGTLHLQAFRSDRLTGHSLSNGFLPFRCTLIRNKRQCKIPGGGIHSAALLLHRDLRVGKLAAV